MWIHLNGRLVPESEAKVSVFDRGFLYGDGVFESMRAVNGTVFRQALHLERLSRSARSVGIDAIPPTQEVGAACRELLDANRLLGARLRITLTRGPGRPGEYLGTTGPATVVISAAPFAGCDPMLHREGVKVVIPQHRQIPAASLDPAVKSTSRLASVLARRQASERGGFEAVLLDSDGHLTEGTVSNLFLVQNGRLLTSRTPSGGLPGITREVVFELARESGIAISEERLPVDLLETAQEAFLTNTSWEILPIIQVDERRIGAGVPGPLTLDLLVRYRELVARECGVVEGRPPGERAT